ncbi:MAG: efflux RND transporter periplasmic adaptor subunit [Planctomycetes bacterium]|nr:efflux RND transporter periplasmic adaptor subunit [Planctomycetota bacterium]
MKRILTWAAVAAAAVLVVAYAAWPRPLEVETAVCSLGRIEAFVLEEAKTRLDDEYVITMPVDGRLLRIDLREGAQVEKASVIARVDGFERKEQIKRLDARVGEIEALIIGVDKAKPKPEDIEAGELAVSEAMLRSDAAKDSLEAARIDYEHAAKRYERNKDLLAGGAISQTDFDEGERLYLMLESRHKGAASNAGAVSNSLEKAKVELKRLRKSIDDNEFQRTAYLAQIRQTRAETAILSDELAKCEIRAPASGPVLEIYQEDEQVLPAGAPLVKIGDLDSICIESDILSEEVGDVKLGQDVEISGPAVGREALAGKVERIWPSGFEKISSLGIEQQRVKVIIAFDNSVLNLRPGVRLDVRIVTAKRENALRVPERALLKMSRQWHVFAVRGTRADLAPVEVGLRNDDYAEITNGLQAGDLVILSPPRELENGARITTGPPGD